jgi:hypothetical protein
MRIVTYPLKLAARKKYCSPQTGPHFFRPGRALEMTLSIIEQHLRKPMQTTILLLINLCQFDKRKKKSSTEKNIPLQVETTANPP